MYAGPWLNALQHTTKLTTYADLPTTAIMIFTDIVTIKPHIGMAHLWTS